MDAHYIERDLESFNGGKDRQWLIAYRDELVRALEESLARHAAFDSYYSEHADQLSS